MRDDLTGLEVSHEFDLDVPYYRRVPWGACKQLCLGTPGCRSVSFLASEELCTLKTATCVEAGLGSGCVQRHSWSAYWFQADRAGATDFVTGPWQQSLHYEALTGQPGPANASADTCSRYARDSAGVAVVHSSSGFRTLQTATEQAAVAAKRKLSALQQALGGVPVESLAPAGTFGQDGNYTFWLNGAHNPATGKVAWLDGSRYVLTEDVLVETPGGCLAVAVGANGTAKLVVRRCDALGFPICGRYGTGNLAIRIQADSSLIVRFGDQVAAGEAGNFCATKGALPFRPTGARGRDMLAELMALMMSDAVVDGYYARTANGAYGITYSDGSPVPDQLVSSTAATEDSCVSALGYNRWSGWLYPVDCEEMRWVACFWPQGNGANQPPPTVTGAPVTLPAWESDGRDLPARVRLFGGAAFLFFTSARVYPDAERMCGLYGGHLASVPDADTDALIAQTYFDLDPPSANFVLRGERRWLTYLGADNSGDRRLVSWVDGTAWEYTNPNFGGVPRNTNFASCLIMSSQGPSGPARWEVPPMPECLNRPANYTCRVPALPHVQPSAAVVSGSSLFELFLVTPRTFPDAQEACQARGGNLASPSLGRDLEVLRTFLYRLKQEVPYDSTLGEYFEVWVGATTNKTDADLIWSDFSWVGNATAPFDFSMWYTAYPPGKAVGWSPPPGSRSAGVLVSPYGNMVMARRRYNISRPFLCEVDVGVSPIASQQAEDGGTLYEVLRTPYALPYHAAEQVCQARGGHLAGVSSPQQLGAVAQLCSAALQALSRAASGGFESHDVSDGCWVGLYCPAGYRGDVGFIDGFGEDALHLLAGFQPSILQGSSCSADSDLLWLDSRSTTGDGGMAGLVSGAASSLSLSSRCGVVRPGAASNSSTATLAMLPCKQYAAFVCERGGRGNPPSLPSIIMAQPAATAAPAASADPTPSGASRYHGCYALVDGQQRAATVAGSLALAPTPLPVLLSQNVSSLAQCYSLTRQAGLAFYTVTGGSACWGGAAGPGLPFGNVSDDAACRQPCTGDAGSSSSQQPGCAAAGYAAVFALTASAATSMTAAPAAPYVCLTEQLLAAPNATVVGQLHLSSSQLFRCEALCSYLAACDLYTYETLAGACVLLAVPGVASLTRLPVYDAQWARTTCVKAARLVAGATPRQLPSTSYRVAGSATHVCSASLGSRVRAVPVVSSSPQDGLPVSDLAACAASCNANATCQGFAVWPVAGSNGSLLLCGTRTGIVVDTSYDWLASRPWVELADTTGSSNSSGDSSAGVEGCLVLPRLATPPAYVCTEYVDAAGWELRRLNSSDEQACRGACDADDDCALYVVYASPPSCSLRSRPFYDSKVLNYTVGSNSRAYMGTTGLAKSCTHSLRLLKPLASPALGFRNRRVRLSQDDAWHLCIPHMDARGVDVFVVDTFKDVLCGRECALRADCNYFITTADSVDTGVCYAKRGIELFSIGDAAEFPDTGGVTRIDMQSVLETCLNLERQLPRSPPAYVCAQQYGAVLAAGARNTSIATAYSCEALCDAVTSCVGYTWMAHNSTCVLGSSGSSNSNSTNSTGGLAARTTGPSWLASQTCVHGPRLMAGPTPDTGTQTVSAGQHVHAAGAWHLCVPVAAWPASAPDLLGAVTLPDAGNSSANYTAVRACSQACASTAGCQLFSLSWRNNTHTSPGCVLRGWSSTAVLAGPGSSQGSDPLALSCLVLSSERAFPTAAGGLAHPRARPAAVQAYRSKQYSVYLQPASYSLAAATCQSAGGGGGQLLSVNSAQELTVVQALLRPYLQARMHPAAGSPQLDTTPFWTGLVRSGNGSSTGWTYSHGRAFNATFVTGLMDAASSSAGGGCGAVGVSANGTASLRAANCTAWFLPFVCEYEMPPVAVNETYSRAQPLQLFPAQAGYSEALQLASAAGAVLAVVDLAAASTSGGSAASTGRHRARALLQAQLGSTAVRFGSASAAASACGAQQLLSSGCWVQLQPPADTCNSTGTAAALCGATALLLTDAASTTASTLQSLAGLGIGTGSGNGSSACAAALVSSASGSTSYVRAPCATQAAFLAAVVDPDAPLRAAQASPPPPPSSDTGSDSSSSGGLSGGAIAGIVVGSVIGALLVAALVAFAVRSSRRRRSDSDSEAISKAANGAASGGQPRSPHSAKGATSAGTPRQPGSPAAAAAAASGAGSVGARSLGDGSSHGAHDGHSQPLTPASVNLVDKTSSACFVKSPGAPSSTESLSLAGSAGVTASRGGQSSAMSLQALVVTAEDPDRDDVTWRIDPKSDIWWDTKEELGKGTFGVVYKGVYKGVPVAVKTLARGSQGEFDMNALKSLLHEARILAKVRHPNVVTCYGGCITDNDVFIVEELMSQNLSQLITAAGSAQMSLEAVVGIAMDVANGLFQLHPTIVHRDLKPDNVLLDTAGRAKISDFGLARFKMASYLASTKNFAAGTLPYMAPETFSTKLDGISEKADIYSLAIVIWSMLSGQLQPWADYHYAAIMFKVSVQGERPVLPEDPARCPPRLASLIKRMWAQQPTARPGAGDVLKQLSITLREITRGGPSSVNSAAKSSDTARSQPTASHLSGGPRPADSQGSAAPVAGVQSGSAAGAV
ncbi:hypothetical protein HXX76_001334 [Chlamydomonas incerta]|uniref:Uncharacterized protein n=1 Tax=Chlamydomonas incerta TaxID=51695 RepID=A0A835WC36_CHLIN|nr:hypothetical protein HXX76_001334 [Chlamydomonas incerta]|eukprot:KAG2444589.1 hypothetical protein HXX76_001334 [Chlamydomonas incerta]